MTAEQRIRIFLTGVDGQAGYELLRSLQALGEVVFSTLAPWNDLAGRESVVLDLSRPEKIRSVLRDVKPHLIVNPAGYTAVDRAENEPALAQVLNVDASVVIAEEANRLGAAIVSYSTDYVYDGSGSRPWYENSPTGPLGVYGATKLAGDRAIAESGVPFIILRTSWLFGIAGTNFVKTMLRMASESEELVVVGDQCGAPTSARVLADVTAQILAQRGRQSIQNFLSERGGIFHACCTGETSWHGFALEIFRQARAQGMTLKVRDVKNIPASAYPTAVRRPANSRLDLTKLRDSFGLVPPDWRVALAQTLPGLTKELA